MRAAQAHRVEAGIGYVAAALFAASAGFAAFLVAGTFIDLRGTVTAATACGLIAYPAARFLLRMLEGQPKPFPQPCFDAVEFDPMTDVEELVLTDRDRLMPSERDEDALVLEDVLAEPAPESRVVQLFDRSAMPPPKELEDRINRHLVGGCGHSPSPDASEALFAALADLRRSLR